MKTLIVTALAALLAAPAVAQTPPLQVAFKTDGLTAEALEQRFVTHIELVCGKADDNSLVGTFKLARKAHADCVNGLALNTDTPKVQTAFAAAKRRVVKG